MKHMLAFAAFFALAACAPAAPSDPDAEYGPHPQLAAPHAGLLPTLNAQKAVGWPAGAAPVAPAGLAVTRFAEALSHPRWLYVLPNGDVLAAESSTKRQEGGGFVGWVRNSLERRAGALGAGPNQITLLRDADGDDVAETRSVFVEGLNQPFGMALIGDHFYVANTDSLMRYAYQPGATHLDGGEKVLDLPFSAADNGHWTRNLLASPDGATLYVSVGSSSNIADYGIAAEAKRAAIWAYDVASGEARVFASGLRNPVGMDFEPSSGALWVAVNERDMLGDTLVPDYMTHVAEGAFYGWPYSYYGQHVDARVKPQDAALVASAIAPDYALGAHTASLGLHFYRGATLPARYRGGVFIGQHGSWNRRAAAGYKVVFVPFADGAPAAAAPEDFLTGFLNARGEAQGRPVGVSEDKTGALLVADDVGDIVWRVAPAR
jgi:glucose/arabinose dehydrogenase